MITYQLESYEDFKNDLVSISETQYKESGASLPLSINHDIFHSMESINKLLILTARHDDELIGYVVYTIDKHPHYSSSIIASQQAIYTKPKYRMSRVPLKLLKYSEDILNERYNIDAIICSIPSSKMNKLLDRLEYEQLEVTYVKYLDKEV